MRKTQRAFFISKKHKFHSPEEIISIREEILQISQSLFANLLGVSKQTINSWECGWRIPSPMAMRFLDIARVNPELILKEVKSIGEK